MFDLFASDFAKIFVDFDETFTIVIVYYLTTHFYYESFTQKFTDVIHKTGFCVLAFELVRQTKRVQNDTGVWFQFWDVCADVISRIGFAWVKCDEVTFSASYNIGG